ncbi:MAG: M14 family metallopeptidase [Actinomycetota bacterium]
MRTRSASIVVLAWLLLIAVVPAGAQDGKQPPQTGFEESEGESWTTHEQELEFLAEVDARSARADVRVVAETPQGRPIHLVRIGAPRPGTAARSRREPTILFVCTQHGNEPAPREACLKLLRDLAFTDDQELVSLIRSATVLFIPTANPDGREANTRGNSAGTDINRDHLNLETVEARAIATVVRVWRPDATLDLHEYGPSLPAIYDDEILYLWPRNLNVDSQVHDLAQQLAIDYIAKQAEEEGYSADEYGQYAVGDQNVFQSAGGPDEGIARNAMGLRHSLGILIESAVTSDPRNGPQEITSEAAVRIRRVDSHMVASHAALSFMIERGQEAMEVTAGAFRRKEKEGSDRSAPVYFGGADNEEPSEDDVVDPPPCGYRLTSQQLDDVRATMRLLGISFKRASKGAYVTMAQPPEPVIPLLLDERGDRHSVSAEPDMEC